MQPDRSTVVELLQSRCAEFDRFVAHVRHTLCTVTDFTPENDSWLDQSRWVPFPREPRHEYRITVVRPAALVELLTDDPARGWSPLAASIGEWGFISRHVYPDRDGRVHYEVIDSSAQSGIFRWSPILQVFDLHLQDAQPALLNCASLCEQAQSVISKSVAGGYQVVATTSFRDEETNYRLELSAHGSLNRVLTTIPISESMSGCWDQRILRVETRDGIVVPAEVVILVYNPGIQPRMKAALHRFEITKFEFRSDLIPDSVVIRPVLSNSRVVNWHRDGSAENIAYDERGNIIQNVTTLGEPTPQAGDHNREIRRAIPVVAALGGATAAAALIG